MKRNPNFYGLASLLMMLMIGFEIPALSQERQDNNSRKGLFVECGGSGVAVLSVNYDFRFSKGRNDGLGMRIGIGGESSKTEPLLGYGEIKTKFFTVPVEVNYVVGNQRFSFEMGYSLTYINETETSSFRLWSPTYSNTDESDEFFVSYVPIGFRLKPKTNGFMLKFNVGPLINYSAPNIFYEEKIQFWAGLALGYSFR